MDNFRFHVIRSNKLNIVFHPESLSLFNVSDKVANALEAYEKLNSFEIQELTDVNKRELQGIFNLFCKVEKTKNKDIDNGRVGELSKLVLLVSHDCNMKCKYCFAQEYKGKPYMDIKTAKKAVKTFLKLYPNKVKSILFFGGEPLLRFDVIKETVQFVNAFCQSCQITTPRFGIVTNGTLLTPQIIDFFQKYKFIVTVSLDGPSEVNDFQRVFPSGKGTHDQVVYNIRKAKERNIRIGVEATFTKKHIERGFSVKSTLKYLHEIGAKTIHLMPVYGMCGDLLLPKNRISDIKNSFKEGVSFALDSLMTPEPIVFQYVHYIIEALITKIPVEYMCYAGIGTLTVDTNGNIYPCYLLMNEDLFMGNIFDHDFPGVHFLKVRELLQNHTREHISQCRKCWAKEICSSCYGIGFLINKSLTSPPEEFCDIQKAMIEETLVNLSEFRISPVLWRKFLKSLKSTYTHSFP